MHMHTFKHYHNQLSHLNATLVWFIYECICNGNHKEEFSWWVQEWWTYICLGPTDPHPNWHLGMRGTQHRAVMWRVWKEGGTGFLYWGANCYEKATVPSAEVRLTYGTFCKCFLIDCFRKLYETTKHIYR